MHKIERWLLLLDIFPFSEPSAGVNEEKMVLIRLN